jgi:hypothetical protein
LFAVAADGATGDAFIVTDDQRHRLNLFKRGAEQTEPLASWQVFEDNAYPYGMPQRENEQREPRVIMSVLFDNDQTPDLLLLCHDRLLLYLSQRQ